MDAPNDELTAQRRVWIARANLAELATMVGRPGLTAAGGRPELQAQIDQHAAAVREALGYGEGRIDVVALAGYASGIRDSAVDGSYSLDPLQQNWARPTWPLLRLLAVCSLADL